LPHLVEQLFGTARHVVQLQCALKRSLLESLLDAGPPRVQIGPSPGELLAKVDPQATGSVVHESDEGQWFV
jgi:hypothetical protein